MTPETLNNNFLDFFVSTMIQSWKFLLKVLIVSSIISIIVAVSIQPTYRAEALVTINDKADGTSLLGNSLGGLSSLAGLAMNLEGGSQAGQSMARLKSRGFFNHLAQDETTLQNILAVTGYNNSTKSEEYNNSIYDPTLKIWHQDKNYNPQMPANVFAAYQRYRKNLFLSENRLSGIITIGYKHFSPSFSTQFTKKIINEMNAVEKELDITQAQSSIEYLLKTVPNINAQELRNATTSLMESQLKMKMLASSQKDYLFKILDGPHFPDQRHTPSRALVCMSIVFLSMFFSVLYLLFFSPLKEYIARLLKL